MWLPTRDQVNSVSRHAITIAGTAITIFGLQSRGFNIDQIKALISALGSTVNDLVVLAAAIAPVYAALKAASSASHANQIQAVKNIATGPGSYDAINAQTALIGATQAIAQDRSIPTSQAAANVLVSATAALPQVQTIVTDKKTADASSSPSVIPAQAA
jgi:hypothetical protein